jgi:uncharacterized protein YwgA
MDQKWKLQDAFASMQSVANVRVLQNAIYIAQDAGLLKVKYDFLPTSGSFALPYSVDLHRDLMQLEQDDLVIDTRTGNSIVLTEKGKESTSNLSDSSDAFLKRVVTQDPARLDSLASVAYVRNLFAESVNETNMPVKIAGYFAVTPERIQEYLDQLSALEQD